MLESTADGARALVRPVRAEDVSAVVELVRAVLAEFGLTFGDGSETDAQLADMIVPLGDRELASRHAVEYSSIRPFRCLGRRKEVGGDR